MNQRLRDAAVAMTEMLSVDELLSIAAARYVADNPPSEQYSTTGNEFLHSAENAYFQASAQ